MLIGEVNAFDVYSLKKINSVQSQKKLTLIRPHYDDKDFSFDFILGPHITQAPEFTEKMMIILFLLTKIESNLCDHC